MTDNKDEKPITAKQSTAEKYASFINGQKSSDLFSQSKGPVTNDVIAQVTGKSNAK